MLAFLFFLCTTLRLDCLNWAETYPYRPDVSVEVRADNDSLYLHWFVTETSVRGTVTRDQGPMWEDSCVEFFCLLPDGKHYTNFEWNCLGYCLSDIQENKYDSNRVHRSPEQLASMPRRASLGRDSIGMMEGETHWELQTAVPLHWLLDDSCWNSRGQLKRGTTIRCNFYKCADRSATPHFVTWKPIRSPKPDFHCPQDFVLLRLR